MAAQYAETEAEMRQLLLNEYDTIPKGDMRAYAWLKRQAGIEPADLPYNQRVSRHKTICQILGLSQQEGGLAGRDINEF